MRRFLCVFLNLMPHLPAGPRAVDGDGDVRLCKGLHVVERMEGGAEDAAGEEARRTRRRRRIQCEHIGQNMEDVGRARRIGLLPSVRGGIGRRIAGQDQAAASGRSGERTGEGLSIWFLTLPHGRRVCHPHEHDGMMSCDTPGFLICDAKGMWCRGLGQRKQIDRNIRMCAYGGEDRLVFGGETVAR